MTSDPATTTPVRPGSDTTARILAAAEALFAEHGFEAVSMNAIAERAGVSKANIFHHFSSKQTLYIEVLRAACRDSAERLQSLSGDTEPFTARLAAFVRDQLAGMIEHGQIHRLIQRELLNDGERRGRELAEKVFGDNFARFVGILRAGQSRGELRADLDPALLATLFIGANVFFFEAREVLRHLPDVTFAHDPRRYSQMLTDLLLHGILAPPNHAAKSLSHESSGHAGRGEQ